MNTPTKYRKKPVVIEAMEWDGGEARSREIRLWAEAPQTDVAIVDTDHIQHLWNYDAGCYIMPTGKTIHAPYRVRCLIVLTLEGEMIAQPGWWIIKGVQGEFYPCDPGVFAKTYEAEDIPPLSDHDEEICSEGRQLCYECHEAGADHGAGTP